MKIIRQAFQKLSKKALMLERAFNFRSESFISIILGLTWFRPIFKFVQYPDFHLFLAVFFC